MDLLRAIWRILPVSVRSLRSWYRYFCRDFLRSTISERLENTQATARVLIVDSANRTIGRGSHTA